MDWQPAVCSVKERRLPLGRALFEHWPLHHHGGRKASEAGEDFAVARIILNPLPEEHHPNFVFQQGLLIRFFGRKYRIGLICATLIRNGVTRKKLSLFADRRNEYERMVYMQMIRAHVQGAQALY